MSDKFKVGQELWCVYNDRRIGQQHTTVVQKVGRKWIELSNSHRMNAETMRLDGGNYSSPGMCYLSREEFEEIKQKNDAWRLFQRKVEWLSADNLCIDDIRAAAKLLQIDIDGEA